MQPPLIVALLTVALACIAIPTLRRMWLADAHRIAGLRRQHDRTLTFPADPAPITQDHPPEIWVYRWDATTSRHQLVERRDLTAEERALFQA